MIFDNGIVQLDDGVIKLYEGRETFDHNGNFKKPNEDIILTEKSSRDYYNLSIQESLSFFIDKVVRKDKFLINDFDKSIISNNILLNYTGD